MSKGKLVDPPKLSERLNNNGKPLGGARIQPRPTAYKRELKQIALSKAAQRQYMVAHEASRGITRLSGFCESLDWRQKNPARSVAMMSPLSGFAQYPPVRSPTAFAVGHITAPGGTG